MAEPIRIALVYPELLGTYGDRGNAEVLAWHAVRHSLAARLVKVPAGQPIPAGLDAYVLGGGEDMAQAIAARLLRSPAGDGLRRAVDEGRAVLAVCGAFQLFGRGYTDAAGRRLTGLRLLDLDTAAGASRLVGEAVARMRENVGASLSTPEPGQSREPGVPGRQRRLPAHPPAALPDRP